MNRPKNVMEYAKFQFPLLTYWLDSPVFLKEVACDVVRTVPLCGNLQNLLNAQSHFTLTALHEFFLCHTSSLTHTAPQLHLRRSSPMFAAFKPSEMLFKRYVVYLMALVLPFWFSMCQHILHEGKLKISM
jgi:hypothetical protein